MQRPAVLETVTVDLFIIRSLGVAMRRFPQFTQVGGWVGLWVGGRGVRWVGGGVVAREGRGQKRSKPTALARTPQHTHARTPLQRVDVVALLDEWAARFFEELDYVREGANATRFADLMREDLPQARTRLAGGGGGGRGGAWGG